MNTSSCVLCDHPEARHNETTRIGGIEYASEHYQCPRCGQFVLGFSLKEELQNDRDRAFRLACVVRERRLRQRGSDSKDDLVGVFNSDVELNNENIGKHLKQVWRAEELLSEFPKPTELIDRGLLNLSRLVDHPMDMIEHRWEELEFLLFCPRANVPNQLTDMIEMGLLREHARTRGASYARITPDGWARIEELTSTEVGDDANESTKESLSADHSPHGESLPMKDDVKVLSNEVFIVHGRDRGLMHEVCWVLQKLDLDPIVLNEKADKGRTIIEKFEQHSDVRYAVVIITPDDEGRLIGDEELKPRARQNVIFELGYFYSKLGRQNVCALLDKSVEFPSDIHGVLHKPVDAAGAWRLQLANEMKAAGMDIDLNKLG